MLRKVTSLITLAVLLAAASTVGAQEKRTAFKPEKHGFNFKNDFNNDVVKQLDVRTGGLCGGMVYSSLDYFNAKMKIPRQDYRPANRTTLQSYIYNRQVHSMGPNLTKWAELGLNPGGRRNNAFFHWGMTSELKNLKAFIDRGKPVPLGVKGVDGSTHQILAIGYKTGRRSLDLRIFVYDPNHPNKTLTMKPNMGGKSFDYTGGGKRWRTYFVDKSYGAKRPPALRDSSYPIDGKVRELLVHFHTGDDDLRGKNDNVHLTLHLTGGGKVRMGNINLRARWLSNYTESASVKLPRPIPKSQIRSIELTTTFGGGIGGDNWDCKRIIVDAYKGSKRERIADRTAFFRFTGSRKSLVIPVRGTSKPAPAGKVTKLKLVIQTGGDDLRGNNDNVDATILFRRGAPQLVRTINARQKWDNNSTHTVELRLRRAVDRSDIVGVILTHTSRGGFGSDDWKMESLKVSPVGSRDGRAYYDRTGRPLKHFKGRSRTFTVRW